MRERQIETLIAEAERHEQAGQWSEAAEVWSQVVQAAPSAIVYLRYSAALQDSGHLVEAEAAARRAIECDGTMAKAYFRLGSVLDSQGRIDEARNAYERGLERDEFQPILTILGGIRQRLNDLSGAEVAWRRSLQLDPDDDEAHFGLGLLLAPSDPTQAAHHLEQARRLAPEQEDVHRELGRVLFFAGRLDEAEHALRDAVSQAPHDAWSHCLLGEVLEEKGELTEARQQYSQALGVDERIGFFHASLAQVLWKLGQQDRANQLFRDALARDASDPITNRKFGLFLEQTGFPRRAAFYLERAVTSDPNDAIARHALQRIKGATDSS